MFFQDKLKNLIPNLASWTSPAASLLPTPNQPDFPHQNRDVYLPITKDEAAAGGSATFKVEKLVDFDNGDYLVSMAVLPNGNVIYTTLNSNKLYLFDAKAASARVLYDFSAHPNIASLVSLTLDPNFAENGKLYLANGALPYSKEKQTDSKLVQIVSCTINTTTNTLDPSSIKILVERPQGQEGSAACFVGKIVVTKDKTAYFAVSDNTGEGYAQSNTSLCGRVLRFNLDSPSSLSTHAKGFKNIFGLTFDSKSGKLVGPDNGARLDDELNVISQGGNYGWPTIKGMTNTSEELQNNSSKQFQDPVADLDGAPTGIAVDTQGIFGWPDAFLIGDYINKKIVQVRLPDAPGASVTKRDLPVAFPKEPVIDVAISPQNSQLYFSTTSGLYVVRKQ